MLKAKDIRLLSLIKSFFNYYLLVIIIVTITLKKRI